MKINDCLLQHLLEAQVEAEASSTKDGCDPGVPSSTKHDDEDDIYVGVGGDDDKKQVLTKWR